AAIGKTRRVGVVAGVVIGVGLLAASTAMVVFVVKHRPLPQPVAVAPVEIPDAAAAIEPPKIKRKPEHDRPVQTKADLRDRAKRLIERARREIIEGKKKAALADLDEAHKIEPDNLSIRTYQAQAKGKLGEGTLVVETTPKGAKVQVDGAAVGQT